MAEAKEKCIRCGKDCHTVIEEAGEKYCCVRCCKDAKETQEGGTKVCKFC